MAASGTNSQTAAQPLPLFRPEVLAAQERMHGDVLRIRPLSPAFFPWLGVAVVGVTLAYLFAGHYTEIARVTVTGSLSEEQVAPGASSSSGHKLLASLVVPERWMAALPEGAAVKVRCPGCAGPVRTIPATVVAISPPAHDQKQTTYTITLALPSDISNILTDMSPLQSSTKLEADIPLGQRPLIHWLMQRNEP